MLRRDDPALWEWFVACHAMTTQEASYFVAPWITSDGVFDHAAYERWEDDRRKEYYAR